MKKITVGVVGLGYWGPNLLRNFLANPNYELRWGCDLIESNLKKTKNEFPSVSLTKNYDDLLNDESLDLIAIATPPETHYPLGKLALEHNKHVWVEKPFTNSKKKGQDLLKLAKKKKKYIHVDFPFMFYGPVLKIKEIIQKEKLGKPFYFYSVRTNLGLLQKEVNVIWDLAPHDLSILFSLFPDLKVKKTYVSGSYHIQHSKQAQIANLVVEFNQPFQAYIHLSWLSPVKERQIIIAFEEKMILFDDIHPTEKVKVYDKNVKLEKIEITALKPVYRVGDIWIPSFDQSEALANELKFLYKNLHEKKFQYVTADIALKILEILDE